MNIHSNGWRCDWVFTEHAHRSKLFSVFKRPSVTLLSLGMGDVENLDFPFPCNLIFKEGLHIRLRLMRSLHAMSGQNRLLKK